VDGPTLYALKFCPDSPDVATHASNGGGIIGHVLGLKKLWGCWLDFLVAAAQLLSLGSMTARISHFWTLVLVITQLVVILEMIATHVTPLARQFTGFSAYAAMLAMASSFFLLVGSPFFWRSHRWLAISGSCVAFIVILVSL